eukprot:CAMPEP_0180663532 /NCGR_PEP_ID=MMETSP1037_2-20121125/59998_1 /TAXON_ID=632150 /ORGANISM="Azadinium spinosum, Strain 3D9" /LENGTH=47 /DNA_ID= /DNA_START= /DNA_END= /DNA_ORIENTATION=
MTDLAAPPSSRGVADPSDDKVLLVSAGDNVVVALEGNVDPLQGLRRC